ncbi:alpha-hydroxy acid oxidase [Roseateles sp. BYS180W]|uniref:Alpha-hydroxy acid oxidase n=1 Tax=Roseateles rivi TaxID=3299028 RepID=A0ABW7FT15_9BURK
MSLPALQALPQGIASLADFEAHARQAMGDEAWAYISGGAADEITLRANREAWDRLRLLPRVLRDLRGGRASCQLLGRTLPHPILLAPIAYQCLAHPDGELATVHAAAAQGAGMVLSAQASVRLEQVAAAMGSASERGPLCFQLYWMGDRGFMRELLARVAAAGFEALVLTVDAPVQGVRDRERRAGQALPPHIRAVNLDGLPEAPPLPAGAHPLFDGLLQRAASWAEVDWLRQHSPLPLWLKGLCHPDDARQAQALGVSGLVVSNHGGRTLDTVPASADLLPPLRQALGPDFTLLVDGGVRRGTDVLKALALGADAVLLGRPYVYALASAGALGVAHALRLLRDELDIAMALSGCRTLADVGPQLLWPPSP